MFISSVYLLLHVGFAFCATNSDGKVEPKKLPLVGPEGERFDDAEVVDCDFIKRKCTGVCELNYSDEVAKLYEGILPVQPGCNPAMKSIHDIYTKKYPADNNIPTPFTSSFTTDPRTAMELHVFIKKPDNKSVITFMSFDETKANFTDIPFVVSINPHEKLFRFNTRKSKEWCTAQEIPYEFPNEYWVIVQLAKCEKKQCFRVYVGPKRNNLRFLYTAYARTLLKKTDFWSVMTHHTSTLEAAFWQKPSVGRESITILRDGLSKGQPIMVRGRVVKPSIEVRFTFKDGSHVNVTVASNISKKMETLVFEISNESVLQTYKSMPKDKKTSHPTVNVEGAIKFEVLSGMDVRAIEVEQCAGEYKKSL